MTSVQSIANRALYTIPIFTSMKEDARKPRDAAVQKKDTGISDELLFPPLVSLSSSSPAAAAAVATTTTAMTAAMMAPPKKQQRNPTFSEDHQSSTDLDICSSNSATTNGGCSISLQPRPPLPDVIASSLRSLSSLPVLSMKTRTPLMLENLKEWPYCPLKRRATRMLSENDVGAEADDGDSMERKRRRRASLLDKLPPHSSLLDNQNRSSLPCVSPNRNRSPCPLAA